jgi:hypothetical protein
VEDELGCDVASGCKPDQYVAVDGRDGVTIACKVTSAGADQFNVSLTIASPAIRFQVNGIVGKTGGEVRISENVGSANLTNPSETPCTLQIVQNANGTFGQIKEGAVWARYICPRFRDPNSAGNGVCATDGAFIFENCDTQ